LAVTNRINTIAVTSCMERPESSLPERSLKKFKPNSFSVESYIANFHRNPAKSIQIIPKLSKDHLSKFIQQDGLRHLASSVQKEENVREILSLLHHKKIPFDVETFGNSGLGECVFKIGKNKKHPLYERAAGLLKRWRKAAKRSGSVSPREQSPEKEKKQTPPPQKVPEKPRSRKINFKNIPKKIKYDPSLSVLAFREVADYQPPPVKWSLQPRIWMSYRVPISQALEKELERCKGPACTEVKDSPDEKFQLRSILPSPHEIDCRDAPLEPKPVVETYPTEEKEIVPTREDNYYRDVPRRQLRNPQRKRKFREDAQNFNHKSRRQEGRRGRKDFKRRRFHGSSRYQESHRVNSKTNTEQVNFGIMLHVLFSTFF